MTGSRPTVPSRTTVGSHSPGLPINAGVHVDAATVTDRDLATCADVGSTCTKVAVVDVNSGELVATAEHRSTVDTDVLDGLDAAVAAIGERCPHADLGPVRVCSSAGGGLRLAVVGHEALVTTEAGRRVGLSAGAKVVHVAAGRLDQQAVMELLGVAPDVLLLVGGTDGGDQDVLRHNAVRLATSGLQAPVVLAGNVDARTAALASLRERGKTALVADNVLPRIGELAPVAAREAIREVFLRHVIGGKGLSPGRRFSQLVRGATPDVVLTAVELFADGPLQASRSNRVRRHTGQPGAGQPPDVGRAWRDPSDVVVVDVGGATTDVCSVLSPDWASEAEGATARWEASGSLWRSRTVEGDLGVRQGAPGVVDAAQAEGLLRAGEEMTLRRAAEDRAEGAGSFPHEAAASRYDERLAELALTVALRRHARGERVGAPTAPRRGGKDLRQVGLVVGSGGVLRHAPAARASQVLASAVSDHSGGWALPTQARRTVDRRYVLAAAGLLADEHPAAAARLLCLRLLLD